MSPQRYQKNVVTFLRLSNIAVLYKTFFKVFSRRSGTYCIKGLDSWTLCRIPKSKTLLSVLEYKYLAIKDLAKLTKHGEEKV